MWILFKRKNGLEQTGRSNSSPKFLAAAQQRFATFMSGQEKKLTIPQKKMILLFFGLLIISIHFFNLCKITRPDKAQQPAPRKAIGIPQDILLPDSLDIRLIRKYHDMNRQQDSLNLQQVH